MCIDVQSVYRVVALPMLSTVPDTSPVFVGLLNIAGESIPVYDLATYLLMPRYDVYTLENSIVVCQLNNKKIGMVIDQIIGIDEIEEVDIQSTDLFKNTSSPFTSITTTNAKTMLILNIDHLENLAANRVGDKNEEFQPQ